MSVNIDISEPIFLLKIKGQKLPVDIMRKIVSFQYEDNEEEMDTLTIIVEDSTLEFVDHELFQEGNEIEAQWG